MQNYAILNWKWLSFSFLLSSSEFDDPSALVVLLEEELVVIDLQSPGWPTLPTPYLAPLHSSAITCSFHISSVPPKLWDKLVNAGKAQQCHQQTHRVRSTHGSLHEDVIAMSKEVHGSDNDSSIKSYFFPSFSQICSYLKGNVITCKVSLSCFNFS